MEDRLRSAFGREEGTEEHAETGLPP